MRARTLLVARLLVGAACAHCLTAAEDPRPIVGPGATREAVIEAYGWPSGQARSGSKEILNYPQGQVTLEGGRVERVDFNPNIPWPPPRPRPGPATATTVARPETAAEFWLTSFDEALREARRRGVRVLALFTGSDWSPASQRWLEDVAFHPEFVNAFMGDFVLLRLDFPTRAQIEPELREQNARVRERYGVTTYPALLVLAPDGARVATIDLADLQPGATYLGRAIAAVRGARDGLAPGSAATPAPAADPSATAAVPATAPAVPPEKPVAVALRSARSLLVWALASGAAFVVAALWLVWRKRPQRAGVRPDRSQRFADAGSGLPSVAEMAAWPRERVCALVHGLAEAEGFLVAPQPGADVDLRLRRPEESRPRVLVRCAAGDANPQPAKRVRELFGTMTAEGVATGWFAAPQGFSAEARELAASYGIALLDGEGLLARLRDLPPLHLPKVIARIVQGRSA